MSTRLVVLLAVLAGLVALNVLERHPVSPQMDASVLYVVSDWHPPRGLREIVLGQMEGTWFARKPGFALLLRLRSDGIGYMAAGTEPIVLPVAVVGAGLGGEVYLKLLSLYDGSTVCKWNARLNRGCSTVAVEEASPALDWLDCPFVLVRASGVEFDQRLRALERALDEWMGASRRRAAREDER